MLNFAYQDAKLPPIAEEQRRRVQEFLKSELDGGNFVPHRCSWTTYDAAFSARAGAAGFIGMTWPAEFGGAAKTSLERFVVTEEMLAAGAPCGAHWIADRQSGPQILRHGSARARRSLLPTICRGECFFAIGMSEPNAGSDLAGVRTRAERCDGGWKINGTKIWTTNAHLAHYAIVLVRTSGESQRHAGLSQFIVKLSDPGVTIRPIIDLAGEHEFNEIFFDDCFVPDDMLLGQEGEGWALVTQELAFERSGPDRFLSDFRLLVEAIKAIGSTPDPHAAVHLGRLVAQLVALRRMSISVAVKLDAGIALNLDAALVKDIGTAFERDVPETVRRLLEVETVCDREGGILTESYVNVLGRAPSFTLRGGTREVLRGVIAKGLGLR